MTTANPYHRPGLLATRAGAPDPLLLVDLWLAQFLDTIEEADLGDGEAAYDLLALYGRLERSRPDLLLATGRQGEYLQARALVAGSLDELARRAVPLCQPAGWLAGAQGLADACDDGADEAELSEWAECLLTDLDDAELVAWASGVMPAPGSGLETCRQRLLASPDRFFPCGVFIQGAAGTIRADLAEIDLDLTGTADKFVVLLDALEEAQRLMDGR